LDLFLVCFVVPMKTRPKIAQSFRSRIKDSLVIYKDNFSSQSIPTDNFKLFRERFYTAETKGLDTLDLSGIPGIHIYFGKNSKQISWPKTMRKLVLRDCELEEVPFLSIPNLPTFDLDLNRNFLSGLAEHFTRLHFLTKLNLSDNHFVSFPSEICSLTLLQELHMDRNFLSQFPPQISSLQQLHVLSVSYNRLVELSNELCMLTNLRTLNVDGNKLWKFPPKFGNLRQLQALSLADMNCLELPLSIVNCHSLEHIHHQQSQRFYIPSESTQNNISVLYIYLRFLAKYNIIHFEIRSHWQMDSHSDCCKLCKTSFTTLNRRVLQFTIISSIRLFFQIHSSLCDVFVFVTSCF
jgi:hypothetical protein